MQFRSRAKILKEPLPVGSARGFLNAHDGFFYTGMYALSVIVVRDIQLILVQLLINSVDSTSLEQGLHVVQQGEVCYVKT
jgi:hypothetical protein